MNAVATLINGHSERLTTLLGGQKFFYQYKISIQDFIQKPPKGRQGISVDSN